ncbi:MAG: hypothetical protein JO035_15255, partial [Betaproteobacteria bacterium]|nr:hypothetical protein [Betaproteobacteria bacterium]
WDRDTEYLSAFLATLAISRARGAYPALADWAKKTRLNPLSGVGPWRDDTIVKEAQERVSRFAAAAVENAAKLLHGETTRA